MAPEKWMEVRILLSFWDGQFTEKNVSFMEGSRVVIIPCSFAYNPMFRAPLPPLADEKIDGSNRPQEGGGTEGVTRGGRLALWEAALGS